jgi:ligand-binding sensor domain-containing protein
MPKGLKTFIIALCWLICQLTVQAQRHYFIPYSVNEGLAQSQVRDIVQSEDGYLWIATVGGISRFDGNQFKTFNKSNGLMNNLTNALFVREDGAVVASCVGGLVTFEEGSITPFTFEAPFENVLVNAFLDQPDRLILGTNGRGLLYFEEGRITGSLDLGSKGRNFIRCLSETSNGLLAGTKSGLILINADQEITNINDSISVTSITEGDGETWIATNGDGLFRYAKGELKQFTKADGLKNMYVRDVCIDQEGYPWVISKNSIQHLNRESQRFKEVRSYDPEITSNMKVLLMDAENNLWIGTDGYGILKFTGEQFEIYSTEDGLSSNIVMDIDQWNDHYVFATYGNGVTLKDDGGADTLTDRSGLTNLTVWSLLPRETELWLGTSDGIQIYDGQKVSAFEDNKRLPFPRISNMYEDASGRVWVATRNGASIWNGDSLYIPPGLSALNAKDVKGFAEINGMIWYTSNEGLIGYQDAQNIKHLNKTNGFPEDYLTCLSKGSQQDLWIGSEEGIIHYAPKTGQFSVHRISEQLSANIINFLVNENDERLWIGTDNGLFSLDLVEYYTNNEVMIQSFNQHDGIISNECNQNASYVDRDGNVWFGTNGGLIKYSNDYNKRTNSEVLGVSFNDIQQNFESILTQVALRVEDPEQNTFQYNESRVTFRYTAIHFTNPDKVSFSHRLMGLDEGWSPATNEQYITFSNLAPGDYAFEVRARINNGDWSEPTAFLFHIAPPFWMRWWFILICVSAIGGAAYFIYHQNRKQRARQRAFTDMQNEAKILGLEQQTLNAHMNRHFIFNALNSIQYYINTQDRKLANQYLTNFAALVRKNLDSAQVETIYLSDELERLKLYINLEQMRFKDRFSFDIQIDVELDTESIQVPSMILQPFVENSIMHGILPSERFGKIAIQIKKHEEGIEFVIDDNGIGVETSVKMKNGTSHHVSNGMKITKQRIDLLAKVMNSSYGVFGPEERKDEHGTTIGTRVRILLPFNYQQFRSLSKIKLENPV